MIRGRVGEYISRYTPPFLRTPTRAAIRDSSSSDAPPVSNSPSASNSESSSVDQSLTSSHKNQLQHEMQQQLEASALQLQWQKIITGSITMGPVKIVNGWLLDIIQNNKTISYLRSWRLYVTVFIPWQDRSASHDRRLPARIIALPHTSRYQCHKGRGGRTQLTEVERGLPGPHQGLMSCQDLSRYAIEERRSVVLI